MSRLHFSPVPGAKVIEFPRNTAESRDVVVAQYANQLAMLVQRHGSYLGRHMFAEAVTVALVDHSLLVNACHDSRAALLEYFDARLDSIGMGFA